jgi:LysR family carnitine catabolism transcriptional activator
MQVPMSGLKTLIAVADEGGVRAAALRLGRTPSAVSMALKQFEEMVGAPLFEGDRKVRLTEFGRFTTERAREVVRHYESACTSIVRHAQEELRRSTVASVTSVAAAILPRAAHKVKQAVPKFEMGLREIHSINLPAAVADGIVEVGFGRMDRPHPEVEFTPLLTDAYELVCSARHPLAAHAGPVAWSDLLGVDFICNESFDRMEAPEFAEIVREARFHVASTVSTFAMVDSNIGVTILPRLCRWHARGDLRFLPLADATAFRTVGAITRRGRSLSPITRRLLRAVEEVVREREAELGLSHLETSETVGPVDGA